MVLVEIFNISVFFNKDDEIQQLGLGYESVFCKILEWGFYVVLVINQDNYCVNWGVLYINCMVILILNGMLLICDSFIEVLCVCCVFVMYDRNLQFVFSVNGFIMGLCINNQGLFNLNVGFVSMIGKIVLLVEIW